MLGNNKKSGAKRLLKVTSLHVSVLLTIFTLLLYILSRPEIGRIRPIDILEMIELKTLDLRFRLRGVRQPGNDIVIIAVDEKTEDDLGRWQTSGRQWIAKLVRLLDQRGAKVIGFDVTLAEPDKGAVPETMEALKTWYLERTQDDMSNLTDVFAYLDELKTLHDYDGQLQQAIQDAGNVILGIYHFWNAESASHLTPSTKEAYRQRIARSKYTITKGISRQPLPLLHSEGFEANLESFSEAAKSFGHFNALPSLDGYVRFFPLLVEYMGDYYPSLNLEVVRASLKPSPAPIIYAVGKAGSASVDFIQLGKLTIPTDETGKLFINFYGPGHTFPHYSLSDVILETIPLETFNNKIVLLGFTSPIYQDLHSISFQQDRTYPGVEVHATVIENILRQDFLIRPEWTTLVNTLVILLLGIFLGIALQRTRPHQGAITALIGLIVVAVMSYTVFVYQKIWLNMTFPLLFIVLDYLVITTYKYFTEERQRKRVRNIFQHYVSPRIVEQMLETIGEVKLGGERKELTAFFSDIRDFTSISEEMTPEELVRFLNEYLSAMTKIVLDHEGTVDKYMGDAIMAFYGAPIRQDDHPVKACRTAVDMINRLQELQVGWTQRGLPPIDIGIGINTGEMSIGNMGSEERFDYTVMGDNVNLASRLEGLNKEYGTNIIISQFTYISIRHEPFILRTLDYVQVKGKKEPVLIYELHGYGRADEQTASFLNLFHEGLDYYRARDWEQAIVLFQDALCLQPGDQPSAMYLTRCEEFQQNPPPDDWDGVYVMKTK